MKEQQIKNLQKQFFRFIICWLFLGYTAFLIFKLYKISLFCSIMGILYFWGYYKLKKFSLKK